MGGVRGQDKLVNEYPDRVIWESREVGGAIYGEVDGDVSVSMLSSR